ncbi:hypothetical protein FAGKG844_260050 [Frankia sp. AgKG'84/4]
MVTVAVEAVGSAPSRLSEPSRAENCPRTVVTIAWRAAKPIRECAGSIDQVPVRLVRSVVGAVIGSSKLWMVGRFPATFPRKRRARRWLHAQFTASPTRGSAGYSVALDRLTRPYRADGVGWILGSRPVDIVALSTGRTWALPLARRPFYGPPHGYKHPRTRVPDTVATPTRLASTHSGSGSARHLHGSGGHPAAGA